MRVYLGKYEYVPIVSYLGILHEEPNVKHNL